jgi:hypothetical protein
MVGQQALLRSKAFRTWFGFPDEWPLPPEKAAALARKRGVTMFAGMAPLFRRFSALAEGDVSRFFSGAGPRPTQDYMTIWGLRNPGPPPAPSGGGSVVAAPAAADALVAAAPGGAAPAAASPAATPAAATAAAAAATPGGPRLLLHKPAMHKRRK